MGVILRPLQRLSDYLIVGNMFCFVLATQIMRQSSIWGKLSESGRVEFTPNSHALLHSILTPTTS